MDAVASVRATDPSESTEESQIFPTATEESSSANVDRIRDILFGSQMRDYEARFARLEQTIIKETTDLKENTAKRFDTFEANIKKELEALRSRWTSERDERTDAIRQLSQDLRDASTTLSKRIHELDDHVSEAQGQLRTDMLQHSRNLSDGVQRKYDEMFDTLVRRVQELRKVKTDRAQLAGMLIEMALRLKDEFEVPGLDA